VKSVRTQLSWLESESIHILREAVAEARKPVMLFSAGKDSTVMAHLALRAAVVDETLRASSSERQGRISDGEDGGSLEQKKREGYF